LVTAVTDYSEQNNSKKNNDIDPKSIYFVFTQFILEVICFISVAVFLGLYLDKLLNTRCLFLIILVFLLAFVPIVNLIKRMRLLNKDEQQNKRNDTLQ